MNESGFVCSAGKVSDYKAQSSIKNLVQHGFHAGNTSECYINECNITVTYS